jgi:iron complex outermembrane receptor protein
MALFRFVAGRRHFPVFLGLLPVTMVSSALLAAENSPDVGLSPLIVTASPIVEEVVIDDYSATSAVVTQDQLRDQNAVDLASALRRTPGVQIARYNPVGAFGGDQGGAVFIRGMGVSRPGGEVKTYIDGIPFYMGLWNHPLLDLLPVNGMESITVHKSPQPQVNGNNFASINLQTRRARKDGLSGDMRVSGGSFGTFVEQANLLGRHGDFDWMLAQGHARSDGHRSNANGELNNIMGRLAYRFDAHWAVETSFVHVHNRARDPGDTRLPPPVTSPRYKTRASLFTASLAHDHEAWEGSFKLYASHGDGDWLDQPAPDGDGLNEFRMSGFRWQERLSLWPNGAISAGLDFDRISGSAVFNRIAPAPRDEFDSPTFSIVSPHVALVQDIPVAPGWSLTPSAGLRFHDHSEFASQAAPHAGVSLASDRLTVFANVSRGINYPGLEAPLLASLIPALGDSWRQLSAEKLDHVELGFIWAPVNATLINASIFRDKVKNRYVFGFPPSLPPPPQFTNFGAYRMQGVELSVRQSLHGEWMVFAGLTLLDPDIDNLPYSPRRAITVGVTGSAGPVRIAIDGQYQSAVWALSRGRAADALNAERVAGFATANARFAYPLPILGEKGEVFLALENIADRDYAYRPGYPMPGRSGQIGVQLGF